MSKGEEDIQETGSHRSQSDYEMQGQVQEWTEDEEKRVLRKLDFTILPLLTLVFFCLQLDRGNIGSALSDNLLVDVGISQYQYNVGQQLLSVGIVVLEIPSNLMLYRFGPRIWISGQVLAWGLVATFQAFQKGLGAYLTTRLLLGLCEAGFIPGGLYCLSMYYKREETSKRFAIYFFGNNFAQACNGLLAYGILRMEGLCGLKGWQWLFLLEGLFTIACGLVFIVLVPKDPSSTKTLVGLNFFNDRERYIMQRRVLLGDASKERKHSHVSVKRLLEILSNWRIYPHVLISMCGIAPLTTLSSYAPSLIKSFGYSTLTANALSSVGPWIQILTTFLSGYLSDITGRRGLVNLGGLSLWWGFSLGCLIVSQSSSQSARYALLTCALAVASCWHPVNGSWLSMNSRSPEERSITMACFVMAANCGGIIGGQLFQSSDKPDYTSGWTGIVCLISVAVAASIFCNIQYRLSNKKLAKAEQEGHLEEKVEHQHLPDKGWRYSL